MTVGPGTRLGRYEVVARIGSGGMGQVFKARDTRLDRLVAVKILARDLASVPDMRQRFEREARAIAALSHPNVLAIHDAGEEQDVFYTVMELLEGETLRRRLRTGPLPIGTIHGIAVQIARGLAAAHDRGVVHRDLKPENVFLEAKGTVKILDFGLARMVPVRGGGEREPLESHETREGTILGTTPYMSPEQVRGAVLDHRSDIFSFGILLHEMLWGRLPFTGESVADVLSAILREEIPERSHTNSVAASLDRILRRCLHKDPGRRYQAAADLVLALEGAEPDAMTGQVSIGAREAAALVAASAPAVTHEAEGLRSVAVLPFADMSPGRDLEYLCDGIAEEIINALMKVPGLRVTARTSAFRFKGASEDMRTVGQALNASSVLEGSVRAAASRLRISTQLISTDDGYQLWSERFDRTLDDVFALQDEIATAVVNALRLTLTSGATRALHSERTAEPEAYTLYLKGRHFWSKRTEESLLKSIECFQSALDRDPAFGRAHAGLADSYLTLGSYGVIDPGEAMPRARAAAQRALEVGGPSPGALATVACVDGLYEWAWAEAERGFLRAIEIGHDAPTAHHWFAINHLVPLGRFAEAGVHLRRALEADPLSAPISVSFGLRSYFAHAHEKAVEEFRGTLAFDPTFPAAHFFLGLALAELGRHDEALEQIEGAVRLSGGSPEMTAARGYVAARAGMAPVAREALAALHALAEQRYVSPSLFAHVHAGMGDAEGALTWLERARDTRATDLAWIAVRPVFDALRGEPRFAAVVRSMHLGDVEVP